MKTAPDSPLRFSPIARSIVAILVAGMAAACIVLLVRGLGSAAAAETAQAAEESPVLTSSARDRRCADCGRVESVTKIEAPSGQRSETYAITVRLRDGSTQVIADAHPARWRQGERVAIIAGSDR